MVPGSTRSTVPDAGNFERRRKLPVDECRSAAVKPPKRRSQARSASDRGGEPVERGAGRECPVAGTWSDITTNTRVRPRLFGQPGQRAHAGERSGLGAHQTGPGRARRPGEPVGQRAARTRPPAGRSSSVRSTGCSVPAATCEQPGQRDRGDRVELRASPLPSRRSMPVGGHAELAQDVCDSVRPRGEASPGWPCAMADEAQQRLGEVVVAGRQVGLDELGHRRRQHLRQRPGARRRRRTADAARDGRCRGRRAAAPGRVRPRSPGRARGRPRSGCTRPPSTESALTGLTTPEPT